MQKSHIQMYRGLLKSIAYYASNALELLRSGAGDLPQWGNDVLSATRTHMKDVTHFLRGQARSGIRYGKSDDHGRAYMATKNLREIAGYAEESLSLLERDAGIFPAWVENKISICAEYMDLMGHWLENELAEGRRYGRPGRGGGRRGGGRGGRRQPGGGPGMGRGRGRRRKHRRNGVHVYPYWNLPYDVHYQPYIEPVILERTPTVESVTPRFRKNVAIILLQGYGFNSIPGNHVDIEWAFAGGHPQVTSAPIVNRTDSAIEIHLTFVTAPPEIQIYGIGYSTMRGELVLLTGPFAMSSAGKRFSRTSSGRGKPYLAAKSRPQIPAQKPTPPVMQIHPGDIRGFQYQPGYGSAMAPGKASTSMAPSKMEWFMPPNRMLEPHRQGIEHRQLGHQTGRRFGVPGFAPGQPGWAGQAGVAQIPRPMRGGGPVQTYGSLGYASMGDGSMDMAARGSIRR